MIKTRNLLIALIELVVSLTFPALTLSINELFEANLYLYCTSGVLAITWGTCLLGRAVAVYDYGFWGLFTVPKNLDEWST